MQPRLVVLLLAGLLLAGPCWGASLTDRAKRVAHKLTRVGTHLTAQPTKTTLAQLTAPKQSKLHPTQSDMFEDCPEIRRLFMTGACLPVTQNLTSGGNILGAVPLLCGECSTAIMGALNTAKSRGCAGYNWLPSLCDKNGTTTPCIRGLLPVVRAIEGAPTAPSALLKSLGSILPWPAVPGLCTPACERTVASLPYVNASRSFEVLSAICAPRDSNSSCHADPALRAILQNPMSLMTEFNTYSKACGNRCVRSAVQAIDPTSLNMLLDFACVKPNTTLDCLTAAMAVNSTTLSDPAYCTAAGRYLTGAGSCCKYVYLGLAGMPGMGNATQIVTRLVECGIDISSAAPCAKATRPVPLVFNLSIPYDWASAHMDALSVAVLQDIRTAFSLGQDTAIDLTRDRTAPKDMAKTMVAVMLLEDSESSTAALAAAMNQTVAAGALGLPQTELLYGMDVTISLPNRPNVAPSASVSLTDATASCPPGSGALNSGGACKDFRNALQGQTPTLESVLGAGSQLCQASCQSALRSAVQTGLRQKQDCSDIAVLAGVCNPQSNQPQPCAGAVLQQLASLGNAEEDSIPFSNLSSVCTRCGLDVLSGIAQGIPEAQPLAVLCSRNRNNVTCLNDPLFQQIYGQMDSVFASDVDTLSPQILHTICDNECLRRLMAVSDPVASTMINGLCVKKGNVYCIEKLVPMFAALSDLEDTTGFCTNLTSFANSDVGCCLGLLPLLANSSASDLGNGFKQICSSFQPSKMQGSCRGNQVAKRYINLSMKWSEVSGKTGEIAKALQQDIASGLGISTDFVTVLLTQGSAITAGKFAVLAEQSTVATVNIQGSSDDSTSTLGQALDSALTSNTLSLTSTQQYYGTTVSASVTTAPAAPPSGPTSAATTLLSAAAAKAILALAAGAALMINL